MTVVGVLRRTRSRTGRSLALVGARGGVELSAMKHYRREPRSTRTPIDHN